MNSNQYRDAIDALGLNQRQAAELMGFHPRTSRKYASGELDVPVMVEKLLELLLKEQSCKTRTSR